MCETKEERSLTKEEKKAIWVAIYENMASDGRHPTVVISERYGGDTEKYLRVMARWHNVSIGNSA